MTEHQYKEVCEWQNRTFKQATPLSCAKHLWEEVQELIDDLENGKTGYSEIADCILLIIGVCNKKGLSYADIVALIDDKMTINRNRKWGDVNEQGYVKHIDEGKEDK